MIGLAQVAAFHQVRQVTHRRNEPIRERGHVADAALVRRLGHLFRLRVIHRQRLLAEHVFARRDRRQSDGRVQEIRRGNDHRVHLIPLRDLFIFGRGDFDARLLARLLQRGRVAIAERDDSGSRTQGEAGKMVLQRDAAAADDGNADWFHEREPRVCRSIRKTQAPPLARWAIEMFTDPGDYVLDVGTHG